MFYKRDQRKLFYFVVLVIKSCILYIYHHELFLKENILTLENINFYLNTAYIVWMFFSQFHIFKDYLTSHWLEDTLYKFLFSLSFMILVYYLFLVFSHNLWTIEVIKPISMYLGVYLKAGTFFVLMYENLLVRPKADYTPVNVRYVLLIFLGLYSLLLYLGFVYEGDVNFSSFMFLDVKVEVNKKHPFLYLAYFYVSFLLMSSGESLLDNYLYIDINKKIYKVN